MRLLARIFMLCRPGIARRSLSRIWIWPQRRRPTTTKATTSACRNCPTATDCMRKHVIGLCLTLSIYVATAVCQSRVSMRIAGPPVQPSVSHHGFDHAVLAGFPYWADYVPTSNTIPSVIVVQAPAPPAENPATKIEERKSSAPLMIEWQGDRYVRRSSTSENSRANPPDYMAEGKPFASKIEKAASGRFASKRTPQALPATSDREG